MKKPKSADAKHKAKLAEAYDLKAPGWGAGDPDDKAEAEPTNAELAAERNRLCVQGAKLAGTIGARREIKREAYQRKTPGLESVSPARIKP